MGPLAAAIFNLFQATCLGAAKPAVDTSHFWVAGVLVHLVGATLTSVGFLLQKRSHMQRKGKEGKEDSYWTDTPWLMGGLVWVIGNIVSWFGSGLAPQSLLSGLNVWNIVVTLIASWFFLGERVTKFTAAGCALLLFGCAWVVASGPKSYQVATIDVLQQALLRTDTMFLLLLTSCILIGSAAHALVSVRAGEPHRANFAFTMMSAALAWYATVQSRCMAALMVTSINQWQPHFFHWLFGLLALGFCLCGALQIHFLNLSMKYGDAVVVLPSYMAMALSGEIVVGGLFFNEFDGLGLGFHASFWPGVACVVSGVFVLNISDDSPETRPLVPGAREVPEREREREREPRQYVRKAAPVESRPFPSIIKY